MAYSLAKTLFKVLTSSLSFDDASFVEPPRLEEKILVLLALGDANETVVLNAAAVEIVAAKTKRGNCIVIGSFKDICWQRG